MSGRPSPEEPERIGREAAMILTSWLSELQAINPTAAEHVVTFNNSDDRDKPTVGVTCWLADTQQGNLIHEATRRTTAVVGTKKCRRLAELVVKRLTDSDLERVEQIRRNPEVEANRYLRGETHGHDAFTRAIRDAAWETEVTMRDLIPQMTDALLEESPEPYQLVVAKADHAVAKLIHVKTTPKKSLLQGARTAGGSVQTQ